MAHQAKAGGGRGRREGRDGRHSGEARHGKRGGSRERAGGGAACGRHTRHGDRVCLETDAPTASGQRPSSVWDDYVHTPVVPMHLRAWVPRMRAPPPAHIPQLRIVSYNLLAESLEQNTTQGLAAGIASWDARKQLLAHELAAWDADIYCLQEVDHYEDFLLPLMARRDYDGEFLRRRGERQDGCAMFWRRSKLRRAAYTPLAFDVSSTFDRPNVAQIIEFRTLGGGDKAFVVANTHILFNPKRGDIKLQQVALTAWTLWECSDKGAKAVIYCGDFNTAPFSPLYDFLASGRLELDGLCPSVISGQVTWDTAVSKDAAPVVREARGGRAGVVRPAVYRTLWEHANGLPRYSKPCTFFAQGKCNKGARCSFLHAPAMPAGGGEASGGERWPQAASRTGSHVRSWSSFCAHLQSFSPRSVSAGLEMRGQGVRRTWDEEGACERSKGSEEHEPIQQLRKKLKDAHPSLSDSMADPEASQGRAAAGTLPVEQVPVDGQTGQGDLTSDKLADDDAGAHAADVRQGPAINVIEHKLQLRSAYAEPLALASDLLHLLHASDESRGDASTTVGRGQSEPAYTTFHGAKGVTVDYIWLTPQVQLVGVWDVLGQQTPCPPLPAEPITLPSLQPDAPGHA